jgi:hypothetical protein
MFNPALVEAFVNAGVGAFIALIVLIGLYRIAHRLGIEFIRAQQAQAEALAQQARSMEGLKESIHIFVTRDNSEHREMLVLLRFMAQQQQTLEEVKREHNERKEQAHPRCSARTA